MRRWWWVIALPVVACGIMALGDLRFVFVAMILVFMVIPFVAFNVHFYSLLSPELRCRLHRQRFLISYGASIKIEYEAPVDEEENSAGHPQIRVPDDELIEWTSVERIERCGHYWLVKLTKDSGYTTAFILAPCEAVDADITYPLYYE